MSAGAERVDVLAVLDDLIADMGTTPGTTGALLAEARDDLRELVEAHKRLRNAARTFDHVPSVEGALRQSDAALARVEPQS